MKLDKPLCFGDYIENDLLCNKCQNKLKKECIEETKKKIDVKERE